MGRGDRNCGEVSGHWTLALAYYGDLIRGDLYFQIIQRYLASSGCYGRHEDVSPVHYSMSAPRSSSAGTKTVDSYDSKYASKTNQD